MSRATVSRCPKRPDSVPVVVCRPRKPAALPMVVSIAALALVSPVLLTGCMESAGAPSNAPTRSGSTGTPAGTVSAAGKKAGTVEDPGSASLHPSLGITRGAFEDLIAAFPHSVGAAILADAGRFLDRLLPVLALPEELLLLVDKSHSLPAGFEPDDLVELSSHGLRVNRAGLQVRNLIIPDLLRMEREAKKAGHSLLFISAYRSRDYQKTVYDRHVSVYGQAAADRESARPGMSQHQLGTTVDIGSLEDDFGESPVGRWLLEHAREYGFSLSYPKGLEELTGYKYEPWHYRYLGPEAAAIEKEYFDGTQQHFLEFLHGLRQLLRSAGSTK